MAGLAQRSKQRVSKYSGGMKRRLNIICALMHDPGLCGSDDAAKTGMALGELYFLGLTGIFEGVFSSFGKKNDRSKTRSEKPR